MAWCPTDRLIGSRFGAPVNSGVMYREARVDPTSRRELIEDGEEIRNISHRSGSTKLLAYANGRLPLRCMSAQARRESVPPLLGGIRMEADALGVMSGETCGQVRVEVLILREFTRGLPRAVISTAYR